MDELIEVDRLLRTTPTTTKPPPLPSGSVALATTTELETLLEGDAGGTGGEAARLAFASGSGSEPGPGLGPERSSGDLGADPDGGRERSPTTHTASVEVLNIAASAPANGDVGGVKSADENGPAVVVPIGLPSTATATATSAETKLDVDMTASNGLNGGAVSALGGAGAGGAGAPRGDDEPADVEKGAKTVEQMQREADHRNIIATRVAKVLLCVNLVRAVSCF